MKTPNKMLIHSGRIRGGVIAYRPRHQEILHRCIKCRGQFARTELLLSNGQYVCQECANGAHDEGEDE